MAFVLQSRVALETEIDRVAQEQLTLAAQQLRQQPGGMMEAAHELRKACKRLRALLRLLRHGLGDAYARENLALRDVARLFSELRDSAVLVEVCDRLLTAPKLGEAEALETVRATLLRRREQTISRSDLRSLAALAVGELEQCAQRFGRWSLTADVTTLRKGACDTYARARKAFSRVTLGCPATVLHEWRKLVKYHRYHIELLLPAWNPGEMKRFAKVIDLSELLGEEHDLQVLKDVVVRECSVAELARGALCDAADARILKLRKSAKKAGANLFSAKPSLIGRRLLP